MGRPPRLELPGVPLHLVQRGNNRSPCFFGEIDRRLYLKCLATAALRRGCAIHAYVLMTNHVHLLVTPNEEGAAGAMMQDLGRRYVRVINTIHERTGSLWEGRFKSSLVDSESYLMACHRYIELNPVRAGMVGHPSAYPWSSYGYYSGARPDPIITVHSEYGRLGAGEEERRAAFRALCAEPLRQRLVDMIREAINTDSAVGSEKFMQRAEEQLGRSVRPPRRGRPPKVVTGKLL
jgi:putative transposase